MSYDLLQGNTNAPPILTGLSLSPFASPTPMIFFPHLFPIILLLGKFYFFYTYNNSFSTLKFIMCVWFNCHKVFVNDQNICSFILHSYFTKKKKLLSKQVFVMFVHKTICILNKILKLWVSNIKY